MISGQALVYNRGKRNGCSPKHWLCDQYHITKHLLFPYFGASRCILSILSINSLKQTFFLKQTLIKSSSRNLQYSSKVSYYFIFDFFLYHLVLLTRKLLGTSLSSVGYQQWRSPSWVLVFSSRILVCFPAQDAMMSSGSLFSPLNLTCLRVASLSHACSQINDNR